MDDLKALVKELIAYTSEEEWFEFKENWYDAVGIGEYISSLSNTAAMLGKENAYLIWGVNNDTHELTNTTFDFNRNVKNEPLKHFLARQVTPDLEFEFKELKINKKRLVVLIVPAAKEVPLFNLDAFREAAINAFVHNLWIDGNAPMITVYSDRIEILSRGTLAPTQTMKGFYLGESVPVNKTLSDIFLQLHISERSGRGVPIITGVYGKDAFEFRENSIVVTIPFEYLPLEVGNKVRNKAENIKLNSTHQRILQEMRNNPNITQEQLMLAIGIGKTAIYKNISFLRENGCIERIGSKKNGYWSVKR